VVWVAESNVTLDAVDVLDHVIAGQVVARSDRIGSGVCLTRRLIQLQQFLEIRVSELHKTGNM
jgi:hypothetical protein